MMRKLINDTCTKTPFMFNGNKHIEVVRVSMGESLGPVLANIIMSELEDLVMRKLIEVNTITFYVSRGMRYGGIFRVIFSNHSEQPLILKSGLSN